MSKAYMGAKVTEEKKQQFLLKMQEKGMNQSEGLEYAIDLVLNGDTNAPKSSPYAYARKSNKENDTKEMEANENKWEDDKLSSEDELLTNGYDELDPIFPNSPLRSDQLECEIRNAWRVAKQDAFTHPEVVFLEELSERCLKLSYAREEYSCPAVEIALPDRIVELVEMIASDAFRESQKGEIEDVLIIMANLAESKAARMYNATRKVEISFSINNWRLIDRMLERENRTRSKENQLNGLGELLYEFMATKVRERSSTGFFASPESEMLEFAEVLKTVSITGEAGL